MSKAALTIILVLVTAFAAFQWSLNQEFKTMNDTLQRACLKSNKAVFVLSAEDVRRPMRRGTMRR